MKITIFGATGALGSQCLSQAIQDGHEVTVLARSPDKLSAEIRERANVIKGNALDAEAVSRSIHSDTEGILFAIGVDRASPEDLCTDVTRHILSVMNERGTRRLVWCGGGSTPVPDDQITAGARFVELFARIFMGLRHRDKEHQLDLLEDHIDIDWIGIRPLQMRSGSRRGNYRVGFDRYSGLSLIHFSDCAHAMLRMLNDDTWIHKAPIIQY